MCQCDRPPSLVFPVSRVTFRRRRFPYRRSLSGVCCRFPGRGARPASFLSRPPSCRLFPPRLSRFSPPICRPAFFSAFMPCVSFRNSVPAVVSRYCSPFLAVPAVPARSGHRLLHSRTRNSVRSLMFSAAVALPLRGSLVDYLGSGVSPSGVSYRRPLSFRLSALWPVLRSLWFVTRALLRVVIAYGLPSGCTLFPPRSLLASPAHYSASLPPVFLFPPASPLRPAVDFRGPAVGM